MNLRLPTSSDSSDTSDTIANDMRGMVARHDWAGTPLGAMVDWPASLRAVVGLMMDSAEAMALWWGPQQRQIYNNAYAARVRPAGSASALGHGAAADWADGWLAIEAQVRRSLAGQPTTGFTDTAGGMGNGCWSLSFTPVRDDAGAIGGVLVIAADIGERVAARAEVERLDRELQASASAKDEFLALLGHELRNPLAPIVTALELMRLRDHSSHREQVIIRRQVKHLTRLVDDLLDVSRITRGKVELRKELVDVKGVLLRAVDMVTPILDEKQQEFHSSIHAMEWFGDPARLAQIVCNLLTNAARYSDRGADIGLLAGVVDGALEIEVTDDGIGISPELLPRIFEPFVQGERQLRSSAGGLGVGLALVKNLAEMHGGSVKAISEGEGKGSTFIVRLPLQSAAQDRPTLATAGGRASGKRVLIVDDNTDAADTLAELLRLHGHHVEVAYSPEVALEMFEELDLDVAFLDIGLPGMDGYQLAALMRQNPKNPRMRYVALTGFGQDNNKAQSRAADFFAHLIKPPQLDDILALL